VLGAVGVPIDATWTVSAVRRQELITGARYYGKPAPTAAARLTAADALRAVRGDRGGGSAQDRPAM